MICACFEDVPSWIAPSELSIVALTPSCVGFLFSRRILSSHNTLVCKMFGRVREQQINVNELWEFFLAVRVMTARPKRIFLKWIFTHHLLPKRSSGIPITFLTNNYLATNWLGMHVKRKIEPRHLIYRRFFCAHLTLVDNVRWWRWRLSTQRTCQVDNLNGS